MSGDGFLVVWHDVTAERDLLDQRERQLYVDPLTGIGNRRAAEQALHLVARWGGEEFLAVLPVWLRGAKLFCERARAAIAELPTRVPLTISAGVAEMAAAEAPMATVARADERLYCAKAEGRNRVC